MTDFRGQLLFYRYDIMDRLKAKGLVPAEAESLCEDMPAIVRFTYDVKGLRRTMLDASTPALTPTEYEYDALNRLTKKKLEIGGL